VDELEEMGIESLYHKQYGEAQGAESIPTFYLHRKESKPYHIDYAFCSRNILDKCKINVGTKEEWLGLSDHMPLCVYIDSGS